MKTILCTLLFCFSVTTALADKCTLTVHVTKFQTDCSNNAANVYVCICYNNGSTCIYSGYTGLSGDANIAGVVSGYSYDIYAGPDAPSADCNDAYTTNYVLTCPQSAPVELCLPTPCMDKGHTNENGTIQTWQLGQNYPNPFNPTTEISYSLATAGDVSITVFDIVGKKVAELVNEYKDAGKYSVVFDATNLSSGLYIYKFESGAYVETKRMVLLK